MIGIPRLSVALLVCFAMCSAFSWGAIPAPSLKWTRLGPSPSSSGAGVAADKAGNVYVVGTFEGTIAFGTTNLTSAGGSDILLVKYTPSGELVWATRIGDTNSEVGIAILLVSGTNLCVVGWKGYQPVIFGSPSPELLLAKFDLDGNFIWMRATDGSHATFPTAAAVDQKGNIVVVGWFRGVLAVSDITLYGLPLFGEAFFILKFDSNGTVLWARGPASFNGGGFDFCPATGVGVDHAGNIFLTGSFRDRVDFGANVKVGPSLGSKAVYVAKFDRHGSAKWARMVRADIEASGFALSVSRGGCCYIAGTLTGRAVIGTNVFSGAAQDLLVAKYGGRGRVHWANAIKGAGADFYGAALTLDRSGNPCVATEWKGTLQFENDYVYAPIGRSTFVWKLNRFGHSRWALNIGGDATVNAGHAVTTDTANQVTVSGTFRETIDIDAPSTLFVSKFSLRR